MKNKIYLSHTWVDPRVVVKISPIHGKGLFAARPIVKDEMIMIWGGVKFKRTDYVENKYRELTIVPISEESYLGLPISDQSESIDEYLNHSCDPTAWLIDEVTVIASRDIKKGEEITVDSATWNDDHDYSYSDDNICRCGTRLCRKILSPDDWMRPDLQKRYAGHFTPFLAKCIQKLKKRKKG